MSYNDEKLPLEKFKSWLWQIKHKKYTLDLEYPIGYPQEAWYAWRAKLMQGSPQMLEVEKYRIFFKIEPCVIKLWGGLPQSSTQKAQDDFRT